uniref:Reverse transcriptase Ty1/copia-type domain-containing protein n=1 Tax=Trichogramma kaykai TaxID=54128 RepID=A0ABD2X129_9HYME
MADSTSDLKNIPKFNGQNFQLWKFQIKTILVAHDLLDIVEGATVKPESTSTNANEAAIKAWVKSNAKAMFVISSSIEYSQLDYLINCTTASEMWTKLSNIHEQKSTSNKLALTTRFHEYKKAPGDTVSQHIAKIENLASQLKDIGQPVPEVMIMAKIISTLPSKYNAFISAWDSVPEADQSLDRLRERLLREETRMTSDDDVDRAFTATTSSARNIGHLHQSNNQEKRNRVCNHCKKPGQIAKYCFAKKRANKARKESASDGSQHTAAFIVAQRTGSSPKSKFEKFRERALRYDCDEKDVWFLDSGASRHICCRREWFSDFLPTRDDSVYLGDGSELKVKGQGNVAIKRCVNDVWMDGVIQDALYVPTMDKNLIATGVLTSNGYSVVLKNDNASIYSRENVLQACGTKLSNNLIQMHLIPASRYNRHEVNYASSIPIALWHERFGHVHREKLIKMINTDAVSGLSVKDKKEFFCENCALGKQHRDPFIKNAKIVDNIEPREQSKHDSDVEDFVDAPDKVLVYDPLSLANRAQSSNVQNDVDSPARNLRPRDTVRAPERYQANVIIYHEPKNYREALACTDADLWKRAIDEEMNALEKNDTWDVVDTPNDRTLIGYKWVFKVKNQTGDKPPRYKARLCAQGFTQEAGIDYQETFSPVVSELEETIYMKIPDGFTKVKPNSALKLNKALYGLKQSGRCWNQKFNVFVTSLGFVRSNADNVDTLNKIVKKLENAFPIVFSNLNYYVGMEIIQYKGGTFIKQELYINKILQRFRMEDSNAVKTPADPSVKLIKSTGSANLQVPYREAVGSLLFLALVSRPDIAYAVGVVSRYLDCYSDMHWTAVKRIFRYLKGTRDYGILISQSAVSSALVVFSDADYAADIDTRRSTSGYVCMMNDGCVAWSSKRQSIVSLSTTEAEFIAAAEAAKEVIWLRKLLGDLEHGCAEPTVINIDNQSSIKLTKDREFHRRSKHIDVRYHFICESVQNKTLLTKYVNTRDQYADIFTKALPYEKFNTLRCKMNIVSYECIEKSQAVGVLKP